MMRELDCVESKNVSGGLPVIPLVFTAAKGFAAGLGIGLAIYTFVFSFKEK